MKKDNRRFLLLVLVPCFAAVFVFLVLPIIGTCLVSFMEYNPLRSENSFVGINNYVRLLHDQSFFKAMGNTLVFTFAAVAINIVLALAMAVAISQFESNRTRSFFRMMVFLPCIAPMVASAVVWLRSLYEPRGGMFNALLRAFGLEGVSWVGDARYLMVSVIIFTLWADIGYNVILFSAGIDGIPGNLYESARLDGAGRWQLFQTITLPLLGRTTTFILLMTLTSYFQMFAQFQIFAPKEGPQQSGLVMTGYIYKQAFVNKEMGYAAAISMALFVVILIVSAVQQRLSRVDWEY